MKPSNAQLKVLRALADGTSIIWRFSEHPFVLRRNGSGSPETVRSGTLTALLDRAWISRSNHFSDAWTDVSATWAITDAGREALK